MKTKLDSMLEENYLETEKRKVIKIMSGNLGAS